MMGMPKDPAGLPVVLRYVSVISGVLILVLAVGFGLAMPWATSAWPWPDGKFSYLFVGSVLAAMGVAAIWIGATAEWGALAAGSLTALIITGGMSAYLFLISG